MKEKFIMTKGKFWGAICMIFICIFIGWAGFRIQRAYICYKNLIGYLDNYVKAGTVEVAKENLSMAIEGLEKLGLTNGQISIFLNDPTENLDLYYRNLKKAEEALEKSMEYNIKDQMITLGKQQNALGDHYPSGISIYPLNLICFWWCVISLGGIFYSAIVLYALLCNMELDDPLFTKIKCKA